MGTYNFLDTDEIIEKATGMTIPEIFDAEGEEGFRQVESQVLDSVHPYVRCVISTGGGIVTRIENWSKLQTGLVVWLDVAPEVTMERIKGTDRPLLQTEDPLQTLKDLLDQRRDKYSQADVRVEVTQEMDENDVADCVIRTLHDFIDVRIEVGEDMDETAVADKISNIFVCVFAFATGQSSCLEIGQSQGTSRRFGLGAVVVAAGTLCGF